MASDDITPNRPPERSPLTFSATLVPHRSLSRTGFALLMAAIGGVSFVCGVVFLIMGAWPIFFFFGLDFLLIYIAFRLNYRSGRIYEVVDLSCDQLSLQRVHPSGRTEIFTFNPAWVRVILAERKDGRNAITLSSHGRSVPFGAFLTDHERREFSHALTTAIIDARGGPRI